MNGMWESALLPRRLGRLGPLPPHPHSPGAKRVLLSPRERIEVRVADVDRPLRGRFGKMPFENRE